MSSTEESNDTETEVMFDNGLSTLPRTDLMAIVEAQGSTMTALEDELQRLRAQSRSMAEQILDLREQRERRRIRHARRVRKLKKSENKWFAEVNKEWGRGRALRARNENLTRANDLLNACASLCSCNKYETPSNMK